MCINIHFSGKWAWTGKSDPFDETSEHTGKCFILF